MSILLFFLKKKLSTSILSGWWRILNIKHKQWDGNATPSIIIVPVPYFHGGELNEWPTCMLSAGPGAWQLERLRNVCKGAEYTAPPVN